ncbi:MAG: YcfL family protein [Burkholderiaceae bacterium]
MRTLIQRFLLAAGLSLLAAGTLAQPVPPAVSPGIAAKLIVRGELLGLQVVDLRAQRRNDVLVVQAEMTNTDTRDLRLFYRFRWTDDNGMQVGDGEVWKPLVFLGRQTHFIKGTGYGPQATDFKIEMSSEPR